MEEARRGDIEGIRGDTSLREVALEQDVEAHVAVQIADLDAGESSIVTLEPPAISITDTTELISNDTGRGLTDGSKTGLLSNDGSVEVDLRDLLVKITELSSDSDVGVDVEEASEGIDGGVATGPAERIIVQVGEGGTVPELTDGVVTGNTVLSSAHLVLDDDIRVGTADGTEGLRELDVNLGTLLEGHTVDDVFSLTDESDLIGVHLGSEGLTRAGTITRRVEGEVVALILQVVGVGDSGVTETEGKGEQVGQSGIDIVVISAVATKARGLNEEEGGQELVEDDGLVLGDVKAASSLEDLLVIPVGAGSLDLTGNAVVLTQEEGLEDSKTVVLTSTTITTSNATLSEVEDGGQDELVGDGDDATSRISDILEGGKPLTKVSLVGGGDRGTRAGNDGVVVIEARAHASINVGTKKVSNVVMLTIDNVQVQPSSRLRSNLETTILHLTTRTQDTHVGSLDGSEGRNVNEESISGIIHRNTNPDVRVVGIRDLGSIQVSLAVDTHNVVSNELSEEGPKQVVTMGGEDRVISTEELVRDLAHVGGKNRLTDSIDVGNTFSSTLKILLNRAEISVAIVVAGTVDLTNVVALGDRNSGGYITIKLKQNYRTIIG